MRAVQWIFDRAFFIGVGRIADFSGKLDVDLSFFCENFFGAATKNLFFYALKWRMGLIEAL